MIVKTFKYRLYPSQSQQRLLEQTLETCRRWYNTCLEERKTGWEERRENISKYVQLRKVKDLKDTNPFAENVHSHILQTTVQDLDKAFSAFFRRVKAGETPVVACIAVCSSRRADNGMFLSSEKVTSF